MSKTIDQLATSTDGNGLSIVAGDLATKVLKSFPVSVLAKVASPSLTGTPTAPTPANDTNNTQLATTAFVKAVIADLVNGAPQLLDTLKEIADQITADEGAAAALTTLVGQKAVSANVFDSNGKFLKAKLPGVVFGKGFLPSDITAGENAGGTLVESNLNTFKILSVEGILNDADLSLGSTTFGTNQTAAVQAILNLATATVPLYLIWDVRCSVTGLNIKSNTYIKTLPGCGAILRNSSNRALLWPANIAGSMASLTSKNITIDGGIWNCNRENQLDYSADYNNMLSTCITMMGVDGLTIKHCKLWGARQFAFHGANNKYVVMFDVEFDHGLTGNSAFFGCDGMHHNGPLAFGYFSNIRIKNNGDDGFALNADEVPTTSLTNTFLGGNVEGDITDVYVENLQFDNNTKGFGVRLLSSAHRADRIVFDGVTGNTTTYLFVIDNLTGQQLQSAGNGNVGRVTLKNITARANGQTVARNTYIAVSCAIERLEIDNYTRNNFADPFNMINISTPGNIKELVLTNLSAYYAAAGFATAMIEMLSGNIDVLRLNGVTLNGVNKLLNHSGGSIGRIVAANIAHLNASGGATFNTAGTIPKIVLSNYDGALPLAGTFTTQQGDAFTAYADTTPPVINSAVATDSHTIQETYSEIVTATNVGHNFKQNGTAITPTAISGSGTNVLTFTFSQIFLASDTLLRSYDASTGNTLDAAGNEVVAFTDQTVTNSVGGVSAVVNESFGYGDTQGIVGHVPTPTGISAWANLVANATVICTAAGTGKSSDASGTAKVVTETNKNNQDVRLTIKTLPASGNAFIIAAVTNDDLNLRLDIVTGQLYQDINTNYLELIPPSGTSAVNDVMRLVKTGNTVTVYRNATQLGTASCSSSLTGTKAGLFIYLDGTVTFDDFKVF